MLLIMLSASGSPSHCIQHAHEEHPPTPVPLHRDITLTPRQRIAVYKELYRLRQMENRTPQQQQRLDEMAAIFEYDGQDTCAAGAPRIFLQISSLPVLTRPQLHSHRSALHSSCLLRGPWCARPGSSLNLLPLLVADGMCQEKCPVKINTGELIKQLRSDEMAEAPRASKMAMVGGTVLGVCEEGQGPRPCQAADGEASGRKGRMGVSIQPPHHCVARGCGSFSCARSAPLCSAWPTTLAPLPGPSTSC